MLDLLLLTLAFTVFAAVVWSVHALNGYAGERYGYEPFAAPNAALMCIPTLLLLSVLSAPETAPGSASATFSAQGPFLGAAIEAGRIKLMLAGAFVVGMLGLLSWRTNLWIGAYATLLMTAAAPVVLMSVLFQRLSR